MTSNLGAQANETNNIGFGSLEKSGEEERAMKDFFRPELRNRIDKVCKFAKLDRLAIKKIVIKLEGKRQKTINMKTLRQQGLDWSEIEIIVNRMLDGFGDAVHGVDFIVDAVAVAELIQPETDKLLKSL